MKRAKNGKTNLLKKCGIYFVVLFAMAYNFSGCKLIGRLIESPVSMVRKHQIWLDEYANIVTYESSIKEYRYFDKYKYTNWDSSKFDDKHKFVNFVNYITPMYIDEKRFVEFLIGPKENRSAGLLNFLHLEEDETDYEIFLNYLYASLLLAEAGKIFLTEIEIQNLNRVIDAMVSITDPEIIFSNINAQLQWVTNKFGYANKEGPIVFVGTYIIGDIKIEGSDDKKEYFESVKFFTLVGDQKEPYIENEPFFGNPDTRDYLEEFLREQSETTLDDLIRSVGK
jgi:hypothetical protein